MRWRLPTVAIALAFVAGCTTTPKPTPSPSSLPSPSPSSLPSPSSPASPVNAAPLVLGPAGIGALKLGMTRAEAESTKLIKPFTHADETNCGWVATLVGAPVADTSAGSVLASDAVGVAAIFAYGSIATPEHIRLGSTRTDLSTAYPGSGLQGSAEHGNVVAAAPGNGAAQYRFELTNGTVTEIALQLTSQDCNE